MCGICGWIELKNKVEPKLLAAMNNIARYRGPDDEGYFLLGKGKGTFLSGEDTCQMRNILPPVTGFSGHAFLGMAHRRLSIIDLSEAGHQPMAVKNAQVCMTYNGEIYNYIELREELQKRGCVFYTNTDTEVLLHAYLTWGENCVEHFIGMWAFAIWDGRRHCLFCSRDRLGAKPFYYYRDSDRFLFASEMKQLCQNPCVVKKLDQNVFVTQVMWGLSDYSEDTMIQDIKELRGGHNLLIQLDPEDKTIESCRISPYWDVCMKNRNDSEEDVFGTLKSAIHLRMRSDVPIGVMLSGGVDSSCITAEVTEHFKEKGIAPSLLHTYTSCYRNFAEGDETYFAQKVNEYCGSSQNFIYPETENPFEEFQNMVWHYEGIVPFSTLGSFLLLKEVAKSGRKVLLNGQGADETMFGYERYYVWYLRDLLRAGHVKTAFAAYKKAVLHSKLSIRELFYYFLYFNIKSVRKTYIRKRMYPYITKRVKRNFSHNKDVYRYLFFDSMKEMQYRQIRNGQLTHILRMDDRSYMAYSMESRVPFIDHRYMERAVNIPPAAKIEDGYTKYLLRRAYENKLPREVVWRTNKMGWPSPAKKWVENFDKNEVEDYFKNSRLKTYFNTNKLWKLYVTKPESIQISTFLSAECLVRKLEIEIAE